MSAACPLICNESLATDLDLRRSMAFVFALRSQTVPQAPSGWLLENETEVAPALAAIVGKKLTVLDIL